MEFILKEINKIQRLMLQILAIMTLIIAKHQKADNKFWNMQTSKRIFLKIVS